jgi:cytochrome bd-type quinol oxidase subunit 2
MVYDGAMSPRDPRQRGANLARPLAFTLLMLYGLLCFLTGYADWQAQHRLAAWAALLLIVCGVLLGAAAIRVIRRRRQAFGLALVALLALLIADLVSDLFPAETGNWRMWLGRAAMSAGMLWLVWRSDTALPPPETPPGRDIS